MLLVVAAVGLALISIGLIDHIHGPSVRATAFETLPVDESGTTRREHPALTTASTTIYSAAPSFQVRANHESEAQPNQTAFAMESIRAHADGPLWRTPQSILADSEARVDEIIFANMHSIAALSGRYFFPIEARSPHKQLGCNPKKSHKCAFAPKSHGKGRWVPCDMRSNGAKLQHVVAVKYECLESFVQWLKNHPDEQLKLVCCLSAHSFPGVQEDETGRTILHTMNSALGVLNSRSVFSVSALNVHFTDGNCRSSSARKLLSVPCGPSILNGPYADPPSGPDRWLLEIASALPILSQRSPRVLCDFHLSQRRLERADAKRALEGNPTVTWLNRRLTKHVYYKSLRYFQAVVTPPGEGWDTHRFWEALVLGCLVIIKREGPLVPWLESFSPNVVLVDRYSEIDHRSLQIWVDAAERHGTAGRIPEVSLLHYWRNELSKPPPQLLPPATPLNGHANGSGNCGAN